MTSATPPTPLDSTPAGRRDELDLALARAGRAVGKASTMLNQAVAESLGLHPTEWECVNLLVGTEERLTAGRIAELTGLTTGAVTGVLDRLERKGWVQRQRDPRDRRRVIVEAVPGKLRGIEEALAGMRGDMRRLQEDYTEEQLAAAADILARAGEVLRTHAVALRTANRRSAG